MKESKASFSHSEQSNLYRTENNDNGIHYGELIDLKNIKSAFILLEQFEI